MHNNVKICNRGLVGKCQGILKLYRTTNFTFYEWKQSQEIMKIFTKTYIMRGAWPTVKYRSIKKMNPTKYQ